MDLLNIELVKDYSKYFEKIGKLQSEIAQSAKNHVDFISRFTKELRKIINQIGFKVGRTDVYLAIISKTNELRENKLIVDSEPNWLKESSKSIDIFNIDYNTNSYIRRFINSILQYFLRSSNSKFRVLVIDEAHMLLNENSETSRLVKQLLREARKFKISVIFISQNFTDISEDIRSQFQNHFNFREQDVLKTKYLSDQICNVSVYGSKVDFVMQVKNILCKSEMKQLY
jgi:DNA helicase HerA-like ATPase